MEYSNTLKEEFCKPENFLNNSFEPRPHTLVSTDNGISLHRIKDMSELKDIMSLGGVVTDWSAGEKLVFSSNAQDGDTKSVGKLNLFIPNDLPDWILLPDVMNE